MARAIGVVLIVLGTIGLGLPFVGPLFGFGMGPDPAWILTETRLIRHVIPAAAIIVGGILLLPRARSNHVVGGLLALVGGIWLTVAPVMLGRVTAESPPALADALRPLLYHYGTGLAIVGLAAYALGVATARGRPERSAGRPAATEPEPASASASHRA